jgi:galactose mutarotase-like enzyme
MIYTIRNDKTEIKINSLGAEVRSVVHNGRERAWQNETGEWSGCAILLFPYAGFNRLVYDGVDFGVQKHGFCRNEEFELVEAKNDKITFVLRANERTNAVYPYDFEFFVQYAIIDNGYQVCYTILHSDNREIPFACGGHESFALDSDVEHYYVEFEKDEKLDFLVHNASGMLTGETVDHGEGRILNLEKDFTDNSATVILGDINSRKATLKNKETNEKIVEVTFDGFENLLLWHPHGSKMLCIEPWQALPSYVDEIKEFKERKGVINLSANCEVSFTRKITY